MEDKLLNSSESKLVLIITLIIIIISLIFGSTFGIICNVVILLIYMYLTNNIIYKNIPDELKQKFNLKTFKFMACISFILFFSIPLTATIISFIIGMSSLGLDNLTTLLISLSPLILAFMINIFLINFSAKLLVTYEIQKLPSFTNKIKTFLLYVVFPFGLFSIQKRIKNIKTNIEV